MITVENLTKRYGSLTAVDDISFTLPSGTVTGLLGPNGAGKSTAMRVVAGLTEATSGRATILGKPYAQLPNPSRQVGVLFGAPAPHAARTGREVLSLGAMLMGTGRERVDEMLELVGLTPDEARRRLRHYSHGMRQRLGIAHALLGDPEVLILDEPANGLDPQGIHWMRGLLQGFAERGGTVLLSSHLLHEVEVVADELIVIGGGHIAAQGSRTELLGASGVVVDALDRTALAEALRAAGFEPAPTSTGAFRVSADADVVGRAAYAAGVVVTELRDADGGGLEELFLQLTASDSRAGAAA